MYWVIPDPVITFEKPPSDAVTCKAFRKTPNVCCLRGWLGRLFTSCKKPSNVVKISPGGTVPLIGSAAAIKS